MCKNKSITPELCRGARAILGWSQQDLAARAEVARTTVADYELGQIAPQARTLRDLVAALEGGGIEFLPPKENISRGGMMLKWDYAAEGRKEAGESPSNANSPARGRRLPPGQPPGAKR